MTQHRLASRTLAVILAVTIAAPQFALARYEPKERNNAFSREEEIKVGQQAAAEVMQQMPILPENDPLTKYIQKLGAKLVSKAPGEKWPYSFRVVNQKEINAFALPGGPMFVNVGTIQAADNEAQLAGVMGHEISHVVMRHATASATSKMKWQAPLSILGAVLGSKGGALAQAAQLGIGFGVNSVFLKYSRDAETEADLVGTDILYDAGFDPKQMAVFFEKLAAEGGGRGPEFLSSHPNPGNRMQRVQQEVASLQPRAYSKNSSDFKSAKQRAMNANPLTAQQIADQAKQGAYKNQVPGGAQAPAGGTPSSSGIQPSSNFKTLNGAAFDVAYPENWAATQGQNSSVLIAPEGGAQGNQIAYGVMIDTYAPQSANSLSDATQQLLSSLTQQNQGLQQAGSPQSIRINGLQGMSVELLGQSPLQNNGQQVRERDWLVTIDRGDGTLNYIVFISPEPDFSSLRPSFEKMLRSFRVRNQ